MSQLIIPPYAREAIQDALLEWLALYSGVGESRCWWQDQDIVETAWPFATLSWTTTTPYGIAYQGAEVLIANPLPVDIAPGVPDLRLVAGQPADVTISVQVFADPKGPPTGQAQARLETAVMKLAHAHIRAPIAAAGLVIVAVGGVTNVAAGQAQVDIACRVALNDVVDDVSIQSTKIYPTINDIAGEAFVVPEGGYSTTATLYAGVAVDIVTEADVLTLLSPADASVFPVTLAVDAAAGEFVFVVLASTLSPTFWFGGFPGGFVADGVVVVAGVNCTIWRSVNAGLGAFSFEVHA